MSSWLSKTTQSVKESVGISSRTVDSDVEGCTAKLLALEKDVSLLRKSLETFSLTLTQHTPAARTQMTTVMLRLGETFVAGGTHFDAFRDAHEVLDNACVSKLLSTFQAAVLQPMDEWVASFAEVKSGAVELDRVRVTYDHYKEKLAGLKKEKDAAILKGKVFDKGSEEKLARNADKLKEVRIFSCGKARCLLPLSPSPYRSHTFPTHPPHLTPFPSPLAHPLAVRGHVQ